ncbi:MAG: OadG family protein [Clostridiales bacterium]|jgi:sodium pump decarboxylase gamma subunit|nr:OadG family protein [Clostridiales bacterium]
MFSEPLSFMDSMIVTALGMGVVFIVLVLLMCIVKLMEVMLYKNAKKDKEPSGGDLPGKSVEAPAPAPAAVSTNTEPDLELAAVIAAAVAANMGVSPSDLVIRRIVRLPETAPIWSLSGRAELMASRSMKH